MLFVMTLVWNGDTPAPPIPSERNNQACLTRELCTAHSQVVSYVLFGPDKPSSLSLLRQLQLFRGCHAQTRDLLQQ